MSFFYAIQIKRTLKNRINIKIKVNKLTAGNLF